MEWFDFIISTLKGNHYYCDRCFDVDGQHIAIDILEYCKNKRNDNRYCTKCWNWIHLKKWRDINGSYHTLRSEQRNWRLRR